MAYYGEPSHPSYQTINTPEMRAKYGWGASGGVKNFTIYETSPVNEPSKGFQLGYQVDYMDRSVPVLWDITPEQAKQLLGSGIQYRKITAPLQYGGPQEQGYWSYEGKLPSTGYPSYIPSITTTQEAQPYSTTASTPFMDYFSGQKSGGSTPTQILQNWAQQTTPKQAPTQATYQSVPSAQASLMPSTTGAYAYTPPPTGLTPEQQDVWNKLEAIKKQAMGIKEQIPTATGFDTGEASGGVSADLTGGTGGTTQTTDDRFAAMARAAGITDTTGVVDLPTLIAKLIGQQSSLTDLSTKYRTETGLTAAEARVAQVTKQLDDLEANINARISGKMVTEPLRQRMLAIEQKPLAKQLQTYQTEATSARQQYSDLLSAAQAEQSRKQSLLPTLISSLEYQSPEEKLAAEKELYEYQQQMQQKYETPSTSAAQTKEINGRIMQWNPKTSRYDIDLGAATAPTITQTEKNLNNQASISKKATNALDAEKLGSEDGFANPDTYRKFKTDYINAGGTTSDFFQMFPIEMYISPDNQKSDLAVKAPTPSAWEIDAGIWQWLATDGKDYSDAEKAQYIKEVGRNPNNFGLYGY